MKKLYACFVLSLFSSLPLTPAYAYGSSASSNSCDKPTFSDFEPSANKYLQSFREFSFHASANTAPNSIEVNISMGGKKEYFDAKTLQITPLNNGKLEIKGKVNQPYQSGFVRISAKAHSKPGCEKTDGYLLRVY